MKCSPKDICGYDNRLALNEDQFLKWKASQEGKSAFETGILGPRTAETMGIGNHMLYPGQVVPAKPKVDPELDNICLAKPVKGHKHTGWISTHGGDFQGTIKYAREDIAELKQKFDDIVDDAEVAEASKAYDAHNTTEQLF